MSTTPLQQHNTITLRSLAAALREGSLSIGVSGRALRQIAGPDADEVELYLRSLVDDGMTTAQVATVVDAVADTKDQSIDPSVLLDLVLSGPEVPGIPTCDTAAVMQALVEAARSEVLLVGYAVHNGEKLFARLAQRMREDAKLRVVFCLDMQRG